MKNKSGFVGIINYGSGNINSLKHALKKIGIRSKYIYSQKDSFDVDTIIFPGVGSFDYAMTKIRSSGIDSLIYNECIMGNKKFIGICLGMQILFSSSDEGKEKGLGFVEGKIINFSNKECHVGWNIVQWNSNFINSTEAYYFNHSFKAECEKDYVVGKTNYHGLFASAIKYNNLYGFQFHPEKSQLAGLKLLKKILF